MITDMEKKISTPLPFQNQKPSGHLTPMLVSLSSLARRQNASQRLLKYSWTNKLPLHQTNYGGNTLLVKSHLKRHDCQQEVFITEMFISIFII